MMGKGAWCSNCIDAHIAVSFQVWRYAFPAIATLDGDRSCQQMGSLAHSLSTLAGSHCHRVS